MLEQETVNTIALWGYGTALVAVIFAVSFGAVLAVLDLLKGKRDEWDDD